MTGVHPKELKCSRPRLMPYACFRPLPFNTVRPEGWLKNELVKEANGFTGHQPEFCFPFDRGYWNGEERDMDSYHPQGATPVANTWWYPWEQMGYWIDGAYRCARLIDDQRLLKMALQPVRYTTTHLQDGWFLGPKILFTKSGTEPGRWPQVVLFRAMAGCSEGENDKSLVEAMHNHYLHDPSDFQGGPFGPRERVHIESLLWCYAQTGDKSLLDKAVKIWNDIPADETARMRETGPSNMHGVSFAEVAKLAALIYLYTGSRECLKMAENNMERVFKHHMLVDGVPSASEALTDTNPRAGHETCDVVEFNWSWGYLMMATGQGQYGDRIERSLFNGGMGCIRKDWKGVQYISCPNQVLLTRTSSQAGHPGTAAMLYGPNSDLRPGYHCITACCAGIVSRMIPNYVERMWMDDRQGGLATVLYGPCQVSAPVGQNGEQVEISEETEYPFSESITFCISAKQPVTFPLHLRIPGWCAAPNLNINGVPVPLTPVENGFITLRQQFNPGDQIVLTLPMALAIKHDTTYHGISIERGPLVFSLPITEAWQPIEMPEFAITTPEFPMWAAAAASPWNYELTIDEKRALDDQVTIIQKPVGIDPWVVPPIELYLKARRITGWDLANVKRSDGSEYQVTPQLPVSKQGGAEEDVKMVPCGSTHLRLTILPKGEAL